MELEEEPEAIENYYIYGNKTVDNFSKLRFNLGDYYIRISADNSGDSDSAYQFRVNASVEGDNTENEPNDDIDSAKSGNSISLNTSITGNLQTDEDIDYYHFTISKPGIINIKFSHDFVDTDSQCWRISVLGGIIEKDISGSVTGNITDFEMDTMRLSPVADNTTTDYYLKVEQRSEL